MPPLNFIPRSTPVTQVEVFGDKHLIAVMDAWAMRSANAEPAYEAMHHYLLGVEQELFESEGESGAHGSWPERSGTHKYDHPIMQASRDLMNSLTQADDPNHHWVVTPVGFAMGTRLDYGEFHQTGTEFLPQRRILDLTLEQRQIMVEMLHLWITRAGLESVANGMFFTRVRGIGGRFIG
jgi:phage gpG-like protein